MPRKESNNPTISAQAQQELVSEGIENFELPKSVVTKIAKSALPENAKLQKETVLALVKGSTVFINYLAATAHDVAVSKQHKSISASDIMKALELIEFNHLVPLLESQFQVYRANPKPEKGKKASISASRPAPAPINGTSTSATVPNGNPYPPKPSNPYPSISSGPSTTPATNGESSSSPFTSIPLDLSVSASVGSKEDPMDVDDVE